jgi:acyl-CoA reductase-like NAD-dependent aldehyde dehydrogenase
MADTPIDQIAGIVASARDAFNTGFSRPLDWRKAQLKGILRFMDEHKKDIHDAMTKDLGRHIQETEVGEITTGL